MEQALDESETTMLDAVVPTLECVSLRALSSPLAISSVVLCYRHILVDSGFS